MFAVSISVCRFSKCLFGLYAQQRGRERRRKLVHHMKLRISGGSNTGNGSEHPIVSFFRGLFEVHTYVLQTTPVTGGFLDVT